MTTATEEELKLNEQQDGSVVVGDPAPAEPPAETSESEAEDTRLTEDTDHDEEEQGHAEETEEEARARTERNRARRKQSKDRRKDYIEGLKRELAARDNVINELSQRMSIVERKSTGSEMAQLETAEREAKGYYDHFKKLHGQAVEQANGELAAEAMEKMMLARSRVEQINNIKTAMTKQQQPQAPALDPRLQANATTWMDKNRWFDINGKDEDSRLTLALDQMVRDAGYLPETPQYWEELDARIKKHLPHRTNSGYNAPRNVEQRGGRAPVAGSGREISSSNKGGYTLSAERVQAMKDAGIWDDPKQRADMIRRYQEQDKRSAQ